MSRIEDPKERFEVLMMGFQNTGNEQLDKFIFLLNDSSMVLPKGLMAWKTIAHSLDFSSEKQIQDDWEWCWQFCKFDINAFSDLMEMEVAAAKKLIVRMKTLRMIYPDGSVNEIANGVVKAIIKKGIEKATGQTLGGKQ